MKTQVPFITAMLASFVLACAFGPQAVAQPFPAKTVRFISGFAAGGGNDIMARLLAYKGTGIALIDVMSGQIPLAFSGILPALPYIRAGRFRGLAVTTRARR